MRRQSRAVTASVVLAKASTHNHRISVGEGNCYGSLSIDSTVWVLAFARATLWGLFDSSLKQQRHHCFAPVAITTERHDSAFPRRMSPELCLTEASLEKIEGAGKTGCPQRTHGPRAKKVARARVDHR
jgi:hypothetical protein